MDLFDLVRAAPPPQTVRVHAEVVKDAEAASPVVGEGDAEGGNAKDKESCPSPLAMSPLFAADEESDVETRPTRTSPIFKLDEEEKANVSNIGGNAKPSSPVDRKISEDRIDISSGSDDDQPQPQPLKTKAQQKMFVDVPVPAKKKQQSSEIKPVVVRIKRLTQLEIERLTISISSQKTNKRGRPRKNPAAGGTESATADDSPSPAKKQKPSGSKVHIKITGVQNGAKQRVGNTMVRDPTPPPNPKRSLKYGRINLVSNEMLERYGSRFFNCVVKLKRLKSPHSSPAKRANNKTKPKLSVSFSEAVEILGSKPRKSSKLSAKLSDSVPTRLQRVDATGNVLEDIELKPNQVLQTPSSSSSCSSSSKPSSSTSKRGRPSSCNGGRRGRKLKRSSISVPVTGLASLRIDDSQEEDAGNEAGEEYIVPNELPEYQSPGVRRAGTPNPTKKVTVTTTVSDEEGSEEPEPKPAKKNTKKVLAAAESSKSSAKAVKEQKVDTEPKPVDSEPKKGDAELKKTSQSEPVSARKESGELSPDPIAAVDDAASDDILEIQTSLEDVRQLHTPTSRQSTPVPRQKSSNHSGHFESPESDSSFKSAANEPESSTAAPSATERTQRAASPVRSSTPKDESASRAARSMLNGSETAEGTSSIPEPESQQPSLPIGEIPNLDDDELGQLGEPDFQLSNSRHTISRGTLDDIMTVLDS